MAPGYRLLYVATWETLPDKGANDHLEIWTENGTSPANR